MTSPIDKVRGDKRGLGLVELWTRPKKITNRWEAQPDAGWMS